MAPLFLVAGGLQRSRMKTKYLYISPKPVQLSDIYKTEKKVPARISKPPGTGRCPENRKKD